MTVVLGYQNQRFDNVEPLYCLTGTELVWNRVRRKFIEYAGLIAAMAAEGYSPLVGEIGLPSIRWQIDHRTYLNWGEGIGDVAASNTVLNGETWVGATGMTPPTGWTEIDGGHGGPSVNYQTNGGVLTMTEPNLTLPIIRQTQTALLEQTAYVSYFSIKRISGGDVILGTNGEFFTIVGPGVYRYFYMTGVGQTSINLEIFLNGFEGHVVMDVEYIRNILASDEI